ncbi:MAG: DUF1800 domain-containing protein, partial [Candidatus Hydrogenedentes bacterium]|nr:DUF1800 domain-containing protein [Candidatus Hydrogenedentota bacterium]
MTRRDVLFGHRLAAALTGGVISVPAFAEKTVEDEIAEGGAKAGVDPLLRRLVERCTYGATKADLDLAKQLGYDGYLDYQLDYTAIEDIDLDDRLSD